MIHTAPSIVARQMAPSRCATIAPGNVAPQAALAVGIEQAAGEAADLVLDTGETVGRADLAQDRRRVVGSPIERPVRLPHQRTRLSAANGVREASASGPLRAARGARAWC